MTSSIMRFAGISLSHNPDSVKVVRGKKILSVNLLSGENKLSGVYEGVSKISGTAVLFGDSCFLNYNKLLKMYMSNKSDILALPELGAFRAVLTDISVAAEPKSNYLTVAFEFRAAPAKKSTALLSERYYTAVGGENFWDISYKYNVSVESMVLLNGHIRNIMSLDRGERVRLY